MKNTKLTSEHMDINFYVKKDNSVLVQFVFDEFIGNSNFTNELFAMEDAEKLYNDCLSKGYSVK